MWWFDSTASKNEVWKSLRIFVTLPFVACLMCSGATGQAGAVENSKPVMTTTAKQASGFDLSGRRIDPVESAGGKPVVLIFMRTDCPVSNRYAPTIQSLSQAYAGKAKFFLVYPDASDTAANIESHLRGFSLKLTAVRDPKHELVKVSAVEITPEAAVFNATGELIYHGRIDNWYEDFGRARPAPTTHELQEAIRAALQGTAPPKPVGGVGCYISDLQ
jgi:thiol-disulfide isomerase/thioredoxin